MLCNNNNKCIVVVMVFIVLSAVNIIEMNAAENIAKNGQFPWHVLIKVNVGDSEEPMSYYCAGTLISAEWILTSAYCLEDAVNVTCYFGSAERENMKLQMTSDKFILHDDYDSLARDLALIKLPKKIEFTKTIRPALLAKTSMNYQNLTNKICTTSGFDLFDEKATNSKYLRFEKLRIANAKNCPIFLFEPIPEDLMCVMRLEKIRNGCGDNSGSGLIIKEGNTNKFYVVGIRSIDLSGRCKVQTAIFQSVHSNLKWISSITGIPVNVT